MELNRGIMTALVSCYARGFHAARHSMPIFNDDIAFSILTKEEKEAIGQNWANAIQFYSPEKNKTLSGQDQKLEWVMNTQCIPQTVSRAKYTEDQLSLAIQRGVKQYVILGAGFDTYVFRQKDLPDDFIVFEIDHPSAQAYKLKRMKEMGLKKPAHVNYMAADFTAGPLSETLMKAGFNSDVPSFFSMLGVSMYLEKKVLLALLSQISGVSCRGSSFVFDYLDVDAFNDEIASDKLIKMRQIAAAAGEPMVTGFDPLLLDSEVQNSSMLVYENVSPEMIEEQYFQDGEGGLYAFPHFHFGHLAVR
ncbi:class I SAM-dependent methyltransferase [Bacillus sp. 1P06AnD]|uniref:class I SAM-dependent methyltransferase n=1 Tax=Bacillus sp. 1P06AnD TaxID=3132208 RepID=UPI0039A313A7